MPLRRQGSRHALQSGEHARLRSRLCEDGVVTLRLSTPGPCGLPPTPEAFDCQRPRRLLLEMIGSGRSPAQARAAPAPPLLTGSPVPLSHPLPGRAAPRPQVSAASPAAPDPIQLARRSVALSLWASPPGSPRSRSASSSMRSARPGSWSSNTPPRRRWRRQPSWRLLPEQQGEELSFPQPHCRQNVRGDLVEIALPPAAVPQRRVEGVAEEADDAERAAARDLELRLQRLRVRIAAGADLTVQPDEPGPLSRRRFPPSRLLLLHHAISLLQKGCSITARCRPQARE